MPTFDISAMRAAWPVSGLPDIVHVDNAREFRGRALARGAGEHGGLHVPPSAAWKSAVDRRSKPFRLPHDAQQFLYDFLPFEERRIRRDGLHLFGLRYWDDVLSPWAGRLDRRLRIKFDPRDLSRVFVEGPDGAHWPVRFADLRRPRITLGEHRLALAELRRCVPRAIEETADAVGSLFAARTIAWHHHR